VDEWNVYSEVSNVTSKCNAIMRYCCCHLLRAIIIRSNKDIFIPRAITIRSGYGHYMAKALTIRSLHENHTAASLTSLCGRHEIGEVRLGGRSVVGGKRSLGGSDFS
jgi:hypothetical protein